MNTETRNFNVDNKNSVKVSISLRLVLIVTSFILALLGSWSLDGLFFTELFVSGIIVCSLMWIREVSLNNEMDFSNNQSNRHNS